MTIDDIKGLKEKDGMTEEQISETTDIPSNILSMWFSGELEEPKYMTPQEFGEFLAEHGVPFCYDETTGFPCLLREEAVAYNFNARQYYEGKIKELCDVALVEVIDRKIYTMSTPNRMHQFLVAKLLIRIGNHIEKKRGKCHVYPAPFGVRLFADDETWVEPDILVICKKDIMTDRGCDGAPDLIVEIVSPNNMFHDYVTKLVKYQQAGVHEYWIVDPINERITLYHFQESVQKADYTYEDTIPSKVLEGFEIRVADFIGEYDEAEEFIK